MSVSYKNENGFFEIKTGMNEAIIVDGRPIFYLDKNDQYKLDYDACRSVYSTYSDSTLY